MKKNIPETVYDTIIIGGGFAGVTAARELSQLGRKVLLLEARDRLGGRTWTDNRLGTDLEIGGTWVHWSQPHVWAEITRYGLETFPSPTPEKTYWISGNKSQQGTIEDLDRLLHDGMTRLLQDSLKCFPKPYEPLNESCIEDIDHLSITDRLKELGLSQEEYDVNHGMWATNFSGNPEEGGLTQGLRWAALAMGDWKTMLGACNVYKLKKGTRSLIEAIAGDAKIDIQLSTPVSKVEKTTDYTTVYTRDNQQFAAWSVIVTVPLNALNQIEFVPALSNKKIKASSEGQTSRGVKTWARVKGNIEAFMAVAPGNYPLTLAQYEYTVDGDSIIVGLGPDASRLDPNNLEAVETALRHWIPDIEVIACTGHDWVADEFSQETWPMLRKGQLTGYLGELQKSENSVYLAGSDYANGWMGFIDGAIESGLIVGRKVHNDLTASGETMEAIL